MKKFAGFISALVLSVAFSATCAAMQFQPPVFIGYMYGHKSGPPLPAKNWSISKEVNVKKDALIMGKGKTAIVFKYVLENVGGNQYRKIKSIVSGNGNVFPDITNGHISPNHLVYQINGENGIVAYVDIEQGPGMEPSVLCIRGLWKDGKAVNYVTDVYQFAQGINDAAFAFKYRAIRVMNDTICVPYSLGSDLGEKHIRNGEFRFKWDDKAYWFGIEDVHF